MSSILITGGTGYLGQKLAAHFLKKGWKVRVFDKAKASHKNNAEFMQGDILDKKAVEAACDGMEFVLHLAGLPQAACEQNPGLAFDVNVMGSRNIIDAAIAKGVKRLVYFSTIHAYGRLEGTITEETLPKPQNIYGMTKLLGEFAVMKETQATLPLAIRLSNAYGAPLASNGWELVLNQLCMQAVKSKGIVLLTKGGQQRDFVSIDDAASALDILLAADRKMLKHRLYNIASGKSIKINELANMIAEGYQKIMHKKISISFARDLKAEHATSFRLGTSRIGALGFRPKADMQQEIAETIMAAERQLKESG